MSDIFSSFEPVEETKNVSSDYSDIKPLCASTHGPSRIFTANYKGKKVIVKTLKPEFAQDNQCRENLKKEFETTSQLDHKLIRKALAFELIQGLGECIVLEYVDGKTLAEHVRVGTLNEKEIKSVLIDLCDALTYMHKRGVVHCHLKPENIIVTANDSRAKIIDIGLPDTEYKSDRELLIKENEFIAPELIKGEDADPRSDVYSLGKIIEFIIDRNMLRQYKNVATHCTQFSREQRFDSVAEVRSLITKGFSVVKVILILVALVAVGVAAYVYIPRIIEQSRIEKEERLAVDFEREVQKINAQQPQLCAKYRLNSLADDLDMPDDWKSDSVKLSQQLAPFLDVESLRPQAIQVIEDQKQAIIQRRQRDFDSLLMLKSIVVADSLVSPANESL